MDSKSIFEMLEGQWLLTREINPHGTFEGTASFAKIDDITLQYEEQGELTLNNDITLSDVSKRYLYKLEEGGIAVYFDDGVTKGELFHRLEFDKNGIATATHKCSPDFYKTKIILNFPNSFEMSCDVSGSNKKYQIISSYAIVC